MGLTDFVYDARKSTECNIMILKSELSAIEIKDSLQDHHATYASLLRLALNKGFITEQHYLDATFPILMRVSGNDKKINLGAAPIIVSTFENYDELVEDLRRIAKASSNATVIVTAAAETKGFFDPIPMKEHRTGLEACLRILKLDLRQNSIKVEFSMPPGFY